MHNTFYSFLITVNTLNFVDDVDRLKNDIDCERNGRLK